MGQIAQVADDAVVHQQQVTRVPGIFSLARPLLLHSSPLYVLGDIIYPRIYVGLPLDLEETQVTFDDLYMLESALLTKALPVAPRVGKRFKSLRSAVCFKS